MNEITTKRKFVIISDENINLVFTEKLETNLDEDEENITFQQVVHDILLIACVIAIILFSYGFVLLLFALPSDEEQDKCPPQHAEKIPKFVRNTQQVGTKLR